MQAPQKQQREQQELFEQITERLASADLEAGLLKQSSKAIAEAYGKGIKWDDIFPYGIKRPDGITVRGRLPLSDFGKVEELLSNKLLKKLDLFPRGIIRPDFLEINAHFSNGGMPGFDR